MLELGGTYLSDTLAVSTDKKSTAYFYNLGALFSVQKNLWAGWNYSGISHSKEDGSSESFSASDTGPYIKWQFGRNELYSLSAAYNIYSKAQYALDDANEKWSGTSFWLQWAVSPEFKEGLHIGASLNYYAASYTEKTIDSVESSATNSKTWIFPMLHLTKQW